MKPHIYWRWRLWNCRSNVLGRIWIGCGYTPADAYADWGWLKESNP